MRPLLARLHLSLGALYHAIGRSDEARAAILTARELCKDMEVTFWQRQAEAVLGRIEPSFFAATRE